MFLCTNHFEEKKEETTLGIIEGIYWGIMWEVHLGHQMAMLIFSIYFVF